MGQRSLSAELETGLPVTPNPALEGGGSNIHAHTFVSFHYKKIQSTIKSLTQRKATPYTYTSHPHPLRDLQLDGSLLMKSPLDQEYHFRFAKALHTVRAFRGALLHYKQAILLMIRKKQHEESVSSLRLREFKQAIRTLMNPPEYEERKKCYSVSICDNASPFRKYRAQGKDYVDRKEPEFLSYKIFERTT